MAKPTTTDTANVDDAMTIATLHAVISASSLGAHPHDQIRIVDVTGTPVTRAELVVDDAGAVTLVVA